jgi:glycosyltransferase involved in cell wall biosynthesis
MYNADRFLREAIESILYQSYRDFEFIIFDDGSTDSSVAIAESYHDPRIRIFRSSHVGRAAALNKAVGYARTELLAFMDADDISLQTRFEEQFKCLSENPSVGVVGCWVNRIDEDGTFLQTRSVPENHNEIESKITFKGWAVHFQTCMVRKRYIDQINGFDESLIAAIDYEVVLRLLLITKFYNVQRTLYQHRKNAKSISSIYSDIQGQNWRKYKIKYLSEKLIHESSSKKRAVIIRQMGICEYYHGSMTKANEYLYKALCLGDVSLMNMRYYFPSFLGDRLFSFYRTIFLRKY